MENRLRNALDLTFNPLRSEMGSWGYLKVIK
jgi:hypothetical protein